MEFLSRWNPWRQADPPAVPDTFRRRYAAFEELLEANTELSRLIADVEVKLQGRQLFGVRYVRAQAHRAVVHTRVMVDALARLEDRRTPALEAVVDGLERDLQDLLKAASPARPAARALVTPLEAVDREVVDQVGGKAANLGEARRRADVRVPDGFAVSTAAFHRLLQAPGLEARLRGLLAELDGDDPDRTAEQVRLAVEEAPVPDDVAAALLAAYDALSGGDPRVRVAVRSSAVGEDTELTHGGQYLSVLGVRRDGLVGAWSRVVASLYSPWALAYRVHAGAADEDLAMGVLVLRMVDPRASGVVYSRSHELERSDLAVVTAVRGLGTGAVDGTGTPDRWSVSREPPFAIVDRRVAPQTSRWVLGEPDGAVEVPVGPEEAAAPCLDDARVSELVAIALRLEAHFGGPQDLEWALPDDGAPVVLQTRPLQLVARPVRRLEPATGSSSLLLEGGEVACPGVGHGPVVRVEVDQDLRGFPEGGVLVARHPSPRFAQVLGRAAAIVTDTGSVLGHMASLCREFGVPTLVGATWATARLEHGQEVTVDASSARVHAGRVPGLADAGPPPRTDGPAGRLLARVAADIVPLRLLDPRSPTFAPESCRSLHDVMRYVHEHCYRAMFRLSDETADVPGGASRLVASLPIDLHVIDLGGGVEARQRGVVRPEEVRSVPFRALLGGLMHPEVQPRGPRVVSLGGFLGVLSEQALQAPGRGGERFGDRSYAIVSERYLHFSSRVGYHYSLLDAWCDAEGHKNHVGFSFQGGAASEVRRVRRVRAVGQILTALGFRVDVRGDRVDARLKRGDRATLLGVLDQLGRLLQYTRQLDMLMEDDETADRAAKAFLEGRYAPQALLR